MPFSRPEAAPRWCLPLGLSAASSPLAPRWRWRLWPTGLPRGDSMRTLLMSEALAARRIVPTGRRTPLDDFFSESSLSLSLPSSATACSPSSATPSLSLSLSSSSSSSVDSVESSSLRSPVDAWRAKNGAGAGGGASVWKTSTVSKSSIACARRCSRGVLGMNATFLRVFGRSKSSLERPLMVCRIFFTLV